MNTLPIPRVKALLVATVLPVVFILLLCAQAYGQAGNSPDVSRLHVGQASGVTSGQGETTASAFCDPEFRISISPTLPTEYAPVWVTASGTSGDVCVPEYQSHQVSDKLIRVDFSEWIGPCAPVITPWSETVDVGTLPAGTYELDVFITYVSDIHPPSTILCGSETFTVLEAPDVALNEIAWMGTTASPDDEWIELFNNTGSPIDLSGWTLSAADGSPTVSLSGSIPARGYFLLEGTDDTTVPKVDADQIYTGALNNEGEDLVLRDDASNIVDRVDCSAGWFAGHDEARVPMIRVNTRVDGGQADNWTHNPRCGTATNSAGISWTCTLSVTNVGHALDYGVFFNQRALTATTTTTATTPMEGALLGFINGATTSIDVALYGLNRQSVVAALMAAHDSGVTVRAVGDDDAATGEYSESYQALTATGITVITDTSLSKVQHNSFLVIDGQILWTGSTDLTDSGLTLNANHSIVITDTVLATVYVDEFEEMWAGKFHEDKTDNTTHLLGFDDATLESYFSPTDLVAFEVWEELANADETIHFGMFLWTDALLTERVVERLEAGVKVYGVWDELGAADPSSADEALIEAGAQIRIEDLPGKLNHQFAVIDVEGSDPTVILGSYDWTDAGAYDNDENTLIIHNRELARAYYQEWWRLWLALGQEIYLPLVVRNFQPTATTGNIVITDIFYDGAGSQEPDEYVELINADSQPVQLVGWTLRDEADHIFTFPTFEMAAGQTCRVYTNEDHPEWCGFNYGSSSAIWDNGGDAAYLRDSSGMLIDTYTYLIPGLIIQGQVWLNEEGGPGLAGVDVYRSYANYPGIVVATTDEGGYYQSDFAYIPGDEMVTVWAELEGYIFYPEKYYWRHYHGRESRTLNFIAIPTRNASQ